MFVNFFYPNGKLLCCHQVVTQFFMKVKNDIVNLLDTDNASNSMYVTIGKMGEITEDKIGFDYRNLFTTLEKINLMERSVAA